MENTYKMHNTKLNGFAEYDEIKVKIENILTRNISGEELNCSSSNESFQYHNNEKTLGTDEVKAENVDIVKQYIEDNGLYDRKEYDIKSRKGSSGPSEPLCKIKDPSDLKNETTDHQDDSDSNICRFSFKPVIETRRKGKYCENSSPKRKLYVCHSCDYSTYRRYRLKDHIDSVHLNLKQHQCELCEYATNEKVHLKSHFDTVHLSIKKHVCHLCEHAFNRKRNLKNHIDSVHLNLKHHQCEFCDYAASRIAYLKHHIDSVHVNLKQHKCEFCEYAANVKNHLKRHVESVHLNIKRHKCHICEYSVNCKKDLKRHIDSVHLNLRQHKCDFCEYAANQRVSIKRHMESVHRNMKKHTG